MIPGTNKHDSKTNTDCCIKSSRNQPAKQREGWVGGDVYFIVRNKIHHHNI